MADLGPWLTFAPSWGPATDGPPRPAPSNALATGFATGCAYSLAEFDADGLVAGLELEHRFATWGLRRWHPDADWAVTLLRRRP